MIEERQVSGSVSVEHVRLFLTRALRMDESALVRVRPEADGKVQLWTVLPFDVLVTTTVPEPLSETDVTVSAREWLNALSRGQDLPHDIRNERWRGALPADKGTVVEEIPIAEILRLGESARQALEGSRGKGIGDRRLRDALLDHVAVTVSEADGTTHSVRLRLVMGLLRMGFVVPPSVRVVALRRRLGLSTTRGTAWTSDSGLAVL